jgi:predicted nucleic acid-binding protein
MRMLFADTNYLVALLNPKDALHEKACSVSRRILSCRIVTTDFVLMEMLRVLGRKGDVLRQKAVDLAKGLRSDPNSEVIPASRDLFNRAFDVYASHGDKTWDVVDCASLIVMREKGITEALTHDEHFSQMGFQALLREE